MRWVVVVSLFFAAGLLPACQDPIHDQEIEALGGERDGVPKGPMHRPGQPCLVCHNDSGPAQMVFSLAGTVFQGDATQKAAGTAPASDVLVHFRDSAGHEYSTGTNCAGNFFVQPTDWSPSFPVAIWLEYAGRLSTMVSAAFREGSCAKCHKLSGPAADSPGPVYFRPNHGETDNLPGACQ
jgi:hypothetical protein